MDGTSIQVVLGRESTGQFIRTIHSVELDLAKAVDGKVRPRVAEMTEALIKTIEDTAMEKERATWLSQVVSCALVTGTVRKRY